MAVGEKEGLVALSRRGAEQRRVLQLAEDALETLVRLQGKMLRVFVTHRAEIAPHFANGNNGTAETARGFEALGH